MKKNAAILVIGLALSGLAFSASFDCKLAKSKSEILICGVPELSKADDELYILYKKAFLVSPDKDQFKKESRSAWTEREKTCIDQECLENWFFRRKIALLSVVGDSDSKLVNEDGDTDKKLNIDQESYSRLKDQIQQALKDPDKVKVVECMGVKVYEDPQPLGHPPSDAECGAINAKATDGSGPGPTLLQASSAEICRKQGTVIMSAYEAYRAGFPESQTAGALSEMQTTDTARLWVSKVVEAIYADRLSAHVDTGEAYRQYQVECSQNKNLNTIIVRLPRGSAGD